MGKRGTHAILLLTVFFSTTAVVAQHGENAKAPAPAPLVSYLDPVLGMEFVLVKGGCFEMGDTFGDGIPDEELPVHTVCVDDFYLAKYQVTNEQFKKFIDATGYRTTAEEEGTGWGLGQYGPGKAEYRPGLDWRHPLWPGDSIEKKMNHPVLQVSWDDAQVFARWLGSQAGKHFRLLYEAEYEYAARSGGKRYKYSWGNGDPSGNVADRSFKKVFKYIKPEQMFENYKDGYILTAPVGSFQPNELGVYDMNGNAFSWCEDWYNSDYYKDSPKMNPHGSDHGLERVARGGSWYNRPRFSRASYRGNAPADARTDNIGFRLALPVQE
jgi:formylglycine-generating enzyme required for sulfatase activity